MALRALARVNLAAIERNARRLRDGLSPGCELCAVVKADGYGHGAAASARAALAGGARWLAVATAAEAVALRDAGLEGRMLVLGALSDEELPGAVVTGADLVAWDERFVAALAPRAAPRPLRVHVKLDTGLGRLGTRKVSEAVAVAEAVAATPGLQLTGVMTHFATADDDPDFMAVQQARFADFVALIRRGAPDIIAHAANSAATLRAPATHFNLARCGIALYGADPFHVDPGAHGLEPALELTSYVAAVKRAEPGQSAGYGRRFIAETDTWLATIPIGYGDGLRRGLTNNADVLIRGRRFPLVGTVSMDNITVRVDRPDAVAEGDRVVLIGRDGAQRVTSEELARRLDTISYEVLCGLSARVPRRHHRDGAPA